MLELTKEERADLCKAIALRLLELEGFVLSAEHSETWWQNLRYQAAAHKAGEILDVVIDFSKASEGGNTKKEATHGVA